MVRPPRHTVESPGPKRGVTSRDVRVPHARLIVLASALVVCGALLWLSRSYTFYFDEWSFITQAPDATLAWFFRPHNEHPAILFRAVYLTLLSTAGLRSYLPYMALLLALHLANVLLLFEVARRRAGELVAMAAAALLLFAGGGWEDVLWAFQMAWLASTALGLGMLLALDGPPTHRRAAVVTALLAGSFAFSGIGAVFAIAAAVQLALPHGGRRRLVWLVPVAVLVLVWYVAFGHTGNHPNPQPTAANVFLLPRYVSWGLAQSAGSVIGVGGWAAVAVLLVEIAVIAWTSWRTGTDTFTLAVAAALVGFYAVTGMSRAQLGVPQSGSSRYVYIGMELWIILLAGAARAYPWRGTWRPVAVACVFLASFNSATLLFSFAVAKTVLMERQVADYYALAAMRDDPCLDPNGAVDLLVMPVETDPAQYYRAVDRYGDPRDGMPLVDHDSYEAGLARLRKGSCP
jgi:hypothetical protein